MFEQILKRRPKGATHWQAGYYYNSDECGIWSIWENGKWHGDFKFPDGVMTKLPEEKEPVMSEFEGKSGKWAWEIQKEQQAKVEELQKRLDGALKETQYALQYVEEDMRGNHDKATSGNDSNP
ncbi:hypothetical protein J554_3927 [Acinetobacter baumannii 1277411]|uniref:hypothetical protein n=1 Tax=Acinetobacter baumannii TaxID=470 RepID=UPI0004455497|nr:hypothetical protein [Acinetobacter baumannii]EXE02017.1 hypothetical protein J554_3927 [Acinetobacter baumannii 1277411]